MIPHHFELGAAVRLSMSGEGGVVLGRAEYVGDRPSYYIRYVAADGRQVEEWFKNDALEIVTKAATGEEPGAKMAMPSEESAMSAAMSATAPRTGPRGLPWKSVTFAIEPFEGPYLCIHGVKIPVEVSISG